VIEMARLDAFIERLKGTATAELLFQTAHGAVLSVDGEQRVLVRQALSTPQIVGAFAEIVPAELQAGFPRPGRTVFPYPSPAGAVEIEFDVMEIQGGHGGHDAHGSHGKQGMNHQMPGDDAGTIQMLMKAQFETPQSPLAVEPVVVSGDWAVAGWSQEGRGGRGLLKKGADGWYIHMCGGEGFKHAENLAKTGMPQETAMTIAAELASAEEKLGSEAIARFDSFEGIVEVGPAGHGHGHGAHGTHGTQGG
jgi:hypothetical protein